MSKEVGAGGRFDIFLDSVSYYVNTTSSNEGCAKSVIKSSIIRRLYEEGRTPLR